MSKQGYIRKLKRELYLLERELEKTEQTIKIIETKFGKHHIGYPKFVNKKEELEKNINNKKYYINLYK